MTISFLFALHNGADIYDSIYHNCHLEDSIGIIISVGIHEINYIHLADLHLILLFIPS